MFSKILEKLTVGHPPAEVLARTQFISIQQVGESQKELLTLMEEVLREKYGFDAHQPRRISPRIGRIFPTTYVYLDDGIFTGNRIRYDLTEGEGSIAWIPRMAPSNCRLIIYTLGLHTSGFNYVTPIIQRAAREKRISVTFYYAQKMDNEREADSQAEFLWPLATIANADHADEHVAAYVRYILWLRKQRGWYSGGITRPTDLPLQESFFSSANARHIIESAFFKAGARLVRNGRLQETSLRPLGFEVLPTWGFGTFFLTYRNIPNNCPLVLWSASSGWYPLFPRKNNAQTSSSSASSRAFRRNSEDKR